MLWLLHLISVALHREECRCIVYVPCFCCSICEHCGFATAALTKVIHISSSFLKYSIPILEDAWSNGKALTFYSWVRMECSARWVTSRGRMLEGPAAWRLIPGRYVRESVFESRRVHRFFHFKYLDLFLLLRKYIVLEREMSHR